MNIESQVTSLELSKKLKDLGVKQDSLFYWYKNPIKIIDDTFFIEYEESINVNIYRDYPDPIKLYSAYSASELLELLPDKIKIENINYYFDIKKTHFNYIASYNDLTTLIIDESDKNVCNALAKILIRLIENNLHENQDKPYTNEICCGKIKDWSL